MPTLDIQAILDSVLETGGLSAADLDKLRDPGVPEGLLHDFKAGRLLHEPSAALRLRQEVSALANAEGGLLIIGVNDATRAIDAPPRPGGTDPAVWAKNALASILPYLSPSARIFTVDHPDGQVLVVAVSRAPRLIPLHYGGCEHYHLRFHDGTYEAPDYLISDLILGRRQHPVFELSLASAGASLENLNVLTGGQVVIPGLTLNLMFLLENASLVAAPEVLGGALHWTYAHGVPPVNRQLLQHVEAQVPEDDPVRWHWPDQPPAIPAANLASWRIAHRRSTTHNFPVPPFSTVGMSIDGLRIPLHLHQHSARVRIGVYVLPIGSPPLLFQVEGTLHRGLAGADGSVILRQLELSRLHAGSPIVAWRAN